MKSFSNWKIRTKMIIIFGSLFLIGVIGLSITIHLISGKSIRKIETFLVTTENNVHYFYQEIIRESFNESLKMIEKLAREDLEHIVDNIYDMIGTAIDSSVNNFLMSSAKELKKIAELYYDKYKKGLMTQEEAKKRFEEIILNSKIGKTGYAAGINSKGILVIHPKSPGLDASGYEFMQKAIEMKNGYIEYMWKNPEEEKERAKIGAISYFKPWDIIIWVSSYKAEFLDLVDVKTLKDKIMDIKIGTTGYPFILNSKGIAIMHPSLENSDLSGEKDEDGNLFIMNLLKDAIKNGEGEATYIWKNKVIGEEKSREKIIRYKYLKSLDWIIVAGVYTDELYQTVESLRGKLNELMIIYKKEASVLIKDIEKFTSDLGESLNIMLIVVVLFLISGLLCIFLFSNTLTKSIGKFVKMLENVFSDKGIDLTKTIKIKSSDEIGNLANFFNNFMIKMNEFIVNVKNSMQKGKDVSQILAFNSEQTSGSVIEISSNIKSINNSFVGLDTILSGTLFA